MIECESCRVGNSDDVFFCRSCGTRLLSSPFLPDEVRESGIEALRGVVEQIASARLATAEPAPLTSVPLGRITRDANLRLVSINVDGTDGAIHPLGATPFDIGRTSGNLVLDDPFLTDRHARIVPSPEGRLVVPLEKRNGVYRRLRAPAEIVDGDKILVGKQVLLFERVAEAERAPAPCHENGLVVFGSRCRPPWGRLLQLTLEGIPRDVYHLSKDEIVLGRERTDVVFSDDEIMSSLHAKVSLRGNHVTLEDLGSMNGTFLALREPHLLVFGDVIRMGNEVLRFEHG